MEQDAREQLSLLAAAGMPVVYRIWANGGVDLAVAGCFPGRSPVETDLNNEFGNC